VTGAPATPEGGAPEARRQALLRLRLGVLAFLAGCAVVGFAHGDAAGAPLQPQLATPLTVLAVLVGLGSVFARQLSSLPSTAVVSRVRWSLLGYLCAAGLGAVGLAVTFALGEGTRGLVFAAVGVLFAIRPPPQLAPRAPGAG
jgi:hypothetical protein